MLSILQAYFLIRDEVLGNKSGSKADKMEKVQSQQIDAKVSSLLTFSFRKSTSKHNHDKLETPDKNVDLPDMYSLHRDHT